MKLNSRWLLTLASLGLAVVCILGSGPSGPRSPQFAEVNPFDGISSLFTLDFSNEHHHEGGTASIWKTCSDRGKTDARLIPTDVLTSDQITVMRNMMSGHDHRVGHALWHLLRQTLQPSDRNLIVSSYGQDWNNPHQECPVPKNVVDANYNPYGEDFLFMHRGMVNMLQNSFIEAGLPCVAAWNTMPDENDPSWPVPDNNGSGVKSVSSYNTMKDWEAAFESPVWLKTHSLAQVGYFLELSLHNNMHMRFATLNPPAGFISSAFIPFDNRFPSDWQFDAPAYDWLADPYGAHVNKYFWKLHGLVDQILDRWLDANGYLTVAENCGDDTKCYTWKGTWVGQPMMHHMQNSTVDQMSTLGSTADFHRGELTNATAGTIDAESDSGFRNDPEAFVRSFSCQ